MSDLSHAVIPAAIAAAPAPAAPAVAKCGNACQADADAAYLARAAAILEPAAAEFHADVQRLTVAEVHALQRRVRDDLEFLMTEHYQHATKASDIVGCLLEINVDYTSHCGHLAVAYASAEEVLQLGSLLTQHCPRMANSIMGGACFDKVAGFIYWPRTVTE